MQKPVTERKTRNDELAGSAGYTTIYLEELAREYGVSLETMRHLVGKLGTYADGACAPAVESPNSGSRLLMISVDRAEIVYANQSDMAISIEDILAC